MKEFETTSELILDLNMRSLNIMLKKNRQRGDAWRGSGLVGTFIDIHSMYARLRKLIWDMGSEASLKDEVWIAEVKNALQDMRNFTILSELCLEEENWKGCALEPLPSSGDE